MRTPELKRMKYPMINALGIASLMLFAHSTVVAQEPSAISGGDLGSGRIKAGPLTPGNKPSEISSGDLGSGRLKAATTKPSEKIEEISGGDLGSGRIKAETIKPK